MQPTPEQYDNDRAPAHTAERGAPPTVEKSNVPLLGIGLAVLFAAATFFSGLQVGASTDMHANLGALFSNTSAPDERADLTEFWEVWHLLEEKYVTSSSTPTRIEERVRGAIDGLVNSYDDPYTIFLTPEETSKFEEDISGNFSGVGMEVGKREGNITVIAPLPDTPAKRAGLMPGDVIARIDDTPTDELTVDEAVLLIRGEQGTEVVLTIFREETDELLTVPIIRDTITIPTIETETRGNVFVLRLYSFNALSEMHVQNALREYVTSGATKLVIDLRGNPGGFLESAVAISSYFLPTGKVVVREHFGEDNEKVYRSSGKTLGQHAPEDIVVLVNGGSASASEILAGALQDHGAATLIGTPTYGKGSVQELIDLRSDASLKVTIARWLTPDGRSISEGGLTPNLEVERTPEQYLEGTDPQLDAALELLAG